MNTPTNQVAAARVALVSAIESLGQPAVTAPVLMKLAQYVDALSVPAASEPDRPMRTGGSLNIPASVVRVARMQTASEPVAPSDNELAMMMRMLISALKRRDPESTLPLRATKLLHKYGLLGSPLRSDDPPPSASSDEQDARMSPMTVLPDGSAFCTASFPLPKDHWLYAPQCEEWDSERDERADCPVPILDNSQRNAVIAAVRYAVRGATMNGKDPDFDPDALVLNAAYALCGPANGRAALSTPPRAEAGDHPMTHAGGDKE